MKVGSPRELVDKDTNKDKDKDKGKGLNLTTAFSGDCWWCGGKHRKAECPDFKAGRPKTVASLELGADYVAEGEGGGSDEEAGAVLRYAGSREERFDPASLVVVRCVLASVGALATCIAKPVASGR